MQPIANDVLATFQCSSASRKFLNLVVYRASVRLSRVSVLFSEPKIPQLQLVPDANAPEPPFQCSSASRKFLNSSGCGFCIWTPKSFSALQRAENSSILLSQSDDLSSNRFQCSSASRKFLNRGVETTVFRSSDVSVLFSEPKIPQSPRQRRIAG